MGFVSEIWGGGETFFLETKLKRLPQEKKLTACSIQVQINLRHGWESKDLVKTWDGLIEGMAKENYLFK